MEHPADGSFNIAVVPESSDQDGLSYAWTPTTGDSPSLETSQYSENTEDGVIQKTRLDVGRYRVIFEDINYTRGIWRTCDGDAVWQRESWLFRVGVGPLRR